MRTALNLAIAALLTVSPLHARPAKPKTPVTIKVDSSFTRLKGASNLGFAVGGTEVSFLNVTISAVNDPTIVFDNNGQWCLRAEESIVQLAKGGEYHGVWDGTFLNLEIPQPKGKPKHVDFAVFDHKWRNEGNLPTQ